MRGVPRVARAAEPGAAWWPSWLSSAALACLCWMLLAGGAWYSARTTLYTLTNRRVVMRIGMVLTITLNLPLKQLGSASVRRLNNGAGELALGLKGSAPVVRLHSWPRVKAWTFGRHQPALRCLPKTQHVSEALIPCP